MGLWFTSRTRGAVRLVPDDKRAVEGGQPRSGLPLEKSLARARFIPMCYGFLFRYLDFE